MRRFGTALLLLPLLWAFMPACLAATEYEKGALAFQKRDYFGAIGHFEQALAKRPDNANVCYGLACSFKELGQRFQARSFYEQCILLAPKSKVAQNAMLGLRALDAEAQPRLSNTGKSKPFSLPSLPLLPPSPHYGQPNSLSSSFSFNQPQFYNQSRHFSAPRRLLVNTSKPGPFSLGPDATAYGSSYVTAYGSSYSSQGSYSLPYSMSRQSSRFGGYSMNYHVPQLIVQNYSFPRSPEPPPLVELLAKQEKLVIDEKPSH